jgi:hypothetical protein
MAPENCNEGIDSKGLEEGKGRICSKDNNDSDLTGLDVADVDAAVVVVNGKIRPARGQLSSVFSLQCFALPSAQRSFENVFVCVVP